MREVESGKRRMESEKKVKKRWAYLSFRAAVFFVCFGALAVCGGVLDFPPYVYAPALAVVLAAGWFWVLRPYWKAEERVRLFLEGYALSAGEISACGALSPAAEKMFNQLREVLSPTQLFNMNKHQAQYLALQNQINPHFLYNTLESIRSEALLAGIHDLADMTEALATFFRYTITKVENLVSVEEELQNCETYFKIQQYRFGDRLELSVECRIILYAAFKVPRSAGASGWASGAPLRGGRSRPSGLSSRFVRRWQA